MASRWPIQRQRGAPRRTTASAAVIEGPVPDGTARPPTLRRRQPDRHRRTGLPRHHDKTVGCSFIVQIQGMPRHGGLCWTNHHEAAGLARGSFFR
jgi:hypothetical protein